MAAITWADPLLPTPCTAGSFSTSAALLVLRSKSFYDQRVVNNPQEFSSILFAVVLLFSPNISIRAESATWKTNPESDDWNAADNWSANGPPNGPGDVATFGSSTTNALFFSTDTEVNEIVFASSASGYKITCGGGLAFRISGVGITNNSGRTQGFVVNGGNSGAIFFTNSASAGTDTVLAITGGAFVGESGGFILFSDQSTAGHSLIDNAGGSFTRALGGLAEFDGNSTAGNATIMNHGGAGSFATGGFLQFSSTATAGNATITNDGGQTTSAIGGSIKFDTTANAGSAIFTNNGGAAFGASGGTTSFFQKSTAANGLFINKAATVSGAGGGLTEFYDSSTAGAATFINSDNDKEVSSAGGGITIFHDLSTAGNATFITNSLGGTLFTDSSTAAHGTFVTNGSGLSPANGGTDGGVINFENTSSAGHGVFTTNGGRANGALGGVMFFVASSTAADATLTTNGGSDTGAYGGKLGFLEDSTAANSVIITNGGRTAGAFGGQTYFAENSTSGAATLIANGGLEGSEGGRLSFFDNSTGGTSRVEIFRNGILDISLHNAPGVTIGSIEGTGDVFLGSNKLSVGSNNASTTFSGVIQDGGIKGEVGGSLGKIGNGTLILSGANTYVGSTLVEAGKLIVNGSITSNVTVNSGTFGGSGTTRGITVNKGGTLSPGNSAGILNAGGNLKLSLGSTYLVDLNGTAVGKEYDQANVTGVVTLEGASLSLNLGFTPIVGSQFTIINNDLSDLVNGTFDGLSEGAMFVSGGQTFTISYHGGDGNDVDLMAVPEPHTWVLALVGFAALIIARRVSGRRMS